ncbi:MAG: OmpA family protein [Bacteroidales bacterium]|nr:OmpA family protein [Bacteroidales bacterium]
MKFKAIFTIIIAVFLLSTVDADCQVKINLKKKINREANRRANEKADKGVKKGFDILEKGIEEAITGKDSAAVVKEGAGDTGVAKGQAAGGVNEADAAGTGQIANAQGTTGSGDALTLNWSKYDFVPGDKIIFEDNLIGEENGEFPSRWDLVRGNSEVAEFGGENVIMMRDGAPSIIPYLKNPEKDYLPDVFTIEMDLYHPIGGWFEIYLYDRKNQKDPSSTGWSYLRIEEDQYQFGQARSAHPDKSLNNKARWFHISIAYTSGKLKAYMDETRLINIPHLDFNPTGLTLYTYHATDDNLFMVKNIRIAEGGVKYYDRFLQDGKIVSNGIRFDVGKATLRPESMGVLNEIYKMLSEHPEVKVSIEGHTDSDGDNDFNQKLSEDRAKTVMNQLISMGLSADHLTSKGFGESKPINTNATPEGKAENRRVEFVRTN